MEKTRYLRIEGLRVVFGTRPLGQPFFFFYLRTMLGFPAGSMLRFLLPALLHVRCQGYPYSDPSLLDSTIAHGMVSADRFWLSRMVCVRIAQQTLCLARS